MVTPQRRRFHNERLKADLVLLCVALVWGSAFVAQRAAAAHLGFFLYNGIRFLLGALVLLLIFRKRQLRLTPAEWRGGVLAGLLLFGAAAFQQAGLQFTTAGKAGLITGLYVVLVPLFLALGWRQRLPKVAWIASLFAVAGLFLLSGTQQWSLAPGDGLELAGAVLWALHVIAIGRMAGRVDPVRLSLGQYFVCGLINLLLGVLLEGHTWSGLSAAWWAVLYGGIISVGLGYTLQAVGQRHAPAADAAILLSMESPFAALFGWLFLQEILTPLQMLGCGLMLCGMLLAQIPAFGRARAVQ